MPYSKAKLRQAARSIHWPDLRYNPATGEAKLFYSADEVPVGWTAKRFEHFTPPVGEVLDRDELVAKLTEMGVEINPIWGNAHMKRIIQGDISPAG